MIEGAPRMGVLAGECDADLCTSEVTSTEGAVVFPTRDALIETARATGWYVETRDEHSVRIFCPKHTRHRYGRVIGPLSTKQGRDLGHRWENV